MIYLGNTRIIIDGKPGQYDELQGLLTGTLGDSNKFEDESYSPYNSYEAENINEKCCNFSNKYASTSFRVISMNFCKEDDTIDFNDTSSYMITYDVSDKESLEGAKEIYKQARQKIDNLERKIYILLVAVNCDLEKNCLEDGKNFAKEKEIQHFETSTTENKGIEELKEHLIIKNFFETNKEYLEAKKKLCFWRDDLVDIDANDQSLSILMFGENEAKAYECAEKLFGQRIEAGKDIWKKTVEGLDFYGYTRWPSCEVKERPKSPIYGIYFNIIYTNDYSTENDELNIMMNYFSEDSQGIPYSCKFLARECVEMELYGFYDAQVEENPAFTDKIFQNVLDNHKAMIEMFNEIDVNKNGTIDAQELGKLLPAYEKTNKAKAEAYLKTISKDEVNFNRFRKWYIERGGYNDLINSLEDKIRNMADKKQIRNVFKVCEAEIKEMSQEEKEKEFNSKFNITPTCLDSGIDFSIDLHAGDKVINEAEHIPEYAKDEAFLVTILIGTKSEEASKILKSTLEMLKSMIFSVKDLKEIKDKIVIKFRAEGSFVFIDVLAKNDEKIEFLKKMLCTYDLSKLHLNSKFKFSLGTALKPCDILNEDFEKLIVKAATIKMNVASKIKFSIITKFIFKFFKESKASCDMSQLPKMIISAISFLRMIPKIDSNIELHQDESIQFMKDLGNIFPELGYEKIKSLVDEAYLPKIREMFEQMKSMFGEQAEGFKSAIESVDFENLGVILMVKPVSVMASMRLSIKGMDTVIDKFFN